MLRIVDGIAFEGKASENRWSVSKRVLNSGQVELSARRCTDWHEVPYDPDWRIHYAEKYGADNLARMDAEDAAAREAKSLAVAGRRAKTRVRHLCKVQGLDSLLTLTYRENMQDPVRAWADLKEFVRRMRSALGGSFAYVAVPERQARGAIHWHLAVHRLPSTMAAKGGVKVKAVSVVRAIWLRVLGQVNGEPSRGNIDVARRRRGVAGKSAAKIATYISKYVAKGFADGCAKGANRFSSSMGVCVPKPDRLELRADSLAELCAQIYGDAWGGDLRLVGCWVCPYGDAIFFAAESVTDVTGPP